MLSILKLIQLGKTFGDCIQKLESLHFEIHTQSPMSSRGKYRISKSVLWKYLSCVILEVK